MNLQIIFTSLILILIQNFLVAQTIESDRFKQIEQHLNDLTVTNPGLKETVDFAVSGASIQEFLRGIAESNQLNINVDPTLKINIYNNFTNEKVINILLFIVKEYNLDIRFVGSIMSFYAYAPPVQQVPVIAPREIKAKYNSYNDLLSLDLQEDTLEDVVRKIIQESKKNIILSPGLKTRIISGFIQDATFENALHKIAYANDLKVLKTEDNFYVIKAIEEGDDVLNLETKKTSPFENPFPGLDKAKTKAAKTNTALLVDVKADSLKRPLISIEAVNVPIAEVIQTVATSAGMSYFLYSEIKGATTVRVLDLSFENFLKKILQGTDYTFKTSNQLYLIGDRKIEGLRANKVLQLHYRSAKDIINLIPPDLKKGVEIKEFIELNSILLTGSLPQIDEIEAFVVAIDKVVPMVLIDVIIMDIRKGRSTSTGIQAGISDSVKSGGTIFPGVDFTFSSGAINDMLGKLGVSNVINLGRVKPEFYVKLKALEQNNNVEVRATPKLSTLNGHKATLSIGSTRYYSNETQNVVGSLNPQTVITRQFHEVEANLAITILPIVSGDDQVTLEIDVNNSDFLEAPENRPPASATSQFNSLLRVKNEEMVVLGGLERYEKSENGTGVPILSRIPVLKWLFSSRTRSRSKTITLVFIKPSIIY